MSMICESCAMPIDLPEQIGSPRDFAAIIQPRARGEEHEVMWVICLNTKNRVLHVEELYRGSLNAAIVRPAEVFGIGFRHNAAALAVAHNHPSGDPTPSPEDVAITRRLVGLGKSLEMDVVDHVVVGDGRYVSMRERRLGFDG